MSINHITEIKKVCQTAYESLLDVVQTDVKEPYTFNIDLSLIEDYCSIDIRRSDAHKILFKDLKNINGPALYWFEIDSEIDTDQILNAFNSYKSLSDRRAIPALRARLKHDTKVLYVGKVKKDLDRRLITHLGFSKNKATQGLQLYHWAKDHNLRLKVYVYQFNEAMSGLMELVEAGMASNLKPLIGKHR